jgi:anion-transporting  ArsA/GET3 family ATPase
MELGLHQFCTARLVVVAGKGGVGKTTVSAALARAAARSGLRTVLVDLQGSAALAAMVGAERPFGYEPTPVWADPAGAGSLVARTLDPAVALAEYLDQHGLKRISKRLVTTGVVDVVATAAPGIDDLLVLGKLKQLECSGEADLIVVDGPPAGHAVTFLLAAASLRDAVSTGPIASQADDVLALLADPARCQVVLVTLPETTPVNELVETAEALRERVGAHLGPVVVNGVDAGPQLPTGRALPKAVADAARFRNARRARHAAEIDRLTSLLPGPQAHLPLLPVTAIGTRETEQLADHLLAAAAP